MKKNDKMKTFVIRPDLEVAKGIYVTKKTKLTYTNDKVEQELVDLKLKSMLKMEGNLTGMNPFAGTHFTVTELQDGQVVLFSDEIGYYIPNIPLCTPEEAIKDLEVLKEV